MIAEISEWEEVTTAELKLLQSHFNHYDYHIIEKFPDQKDIIRAGIKAALARKDEKERKLLADLLSKHGKIKPSHD